MAPSAKVTDLHKGKKVCLQNMKKTKFIRLLFYVGYTIFIVTSLLDLSGISYVIGSKTHEPTELNHIIKIARYFSYILLFIKVICTTKVKKTWPFIIILVLTFLGISYYSSTNIELLVYLLVIMSAANIDSKRIFWIIMVLQIIILCTVVSMSQLGILEDLVIDPGYRDRHFLGFLYTTTAPDLLFFILMEYVYLCDGVIKILSVPVFYVACVALMKLTNTRLTFNLTLLSIFYFGFLYNFRKDKPYTKNGIRVLTCLPSVICVASIVMYNSFSPYSKIWGKIDKFLSYRFTFTGRSIDQYGFTLFGQPTEFIEQLNFVDSSYLQIALEFGIIPLCIVVGIYTLIMYHAAKLHKRYLIDIILLVMLFSVTQMRLFTFSYNAIPLLVTSSIELKRNIPNIGLRKWKIVKPWIR